MYTKDVRMMMNLNETRAVDPNTGAEKGRKLARFSLLPWDALWSVAEHFGVGANKYEDRNWEKGMPWSWNADALMRHWTAWWELGENRDPETGSLHIVCVAWHALVLTAFQLRRAGTDDRPKHVRVVEIDEIQNNWGVSDDANRH